MHERPIHRQTSRHVKCRAVDSRQGDWSCEYETKISCEDCIYGGARRQPDRRRGLDPEAKQNQL